MSIVVQIKVSDKGATNRVFNIWKNGKLLGSWRDLDNSSADSIEDNEYTDGYLLGWANSGFSETTTFYMTADVGISSILQQTDQNNVFQYCLEATASAVTNINNLSGSESFIDTQLKLQGSYRTQYPGTHGSEIGSGL